MFLASHRSRPIVGLLYLARYSKSMFESFALCLTELCLSSFLPPAFLHLTLTLTQHDDVGRSFSSRTRPSCLRNRRRSYRSVKVSDSFLTPKKKKKPPQTPPADDMPSPSSLTLRLLAHLRVSRPFLSLTTSSFAAEFAASLSLILTSSSRRRSSPDRRPTSRGRSSPDRRKLPPLHAFAKKGPVFTS
jgi:hypothetical protein